MMRSLLLLVYNILFPLFLLLALPGYLVKMKKRGGFGTGLLERFGIYRRPRAEEPRGGLYVHAVSVGEAMIALKLIRAWRQKHSEPVVLAVSTATAHAVARESGVPGLRTLYAPLDLPLLPGRCLRRFRPGRVALIEAELWPNFAEAAHRAGIPVTMLNARLSPRSERRYAKVRKLAALFFSRLAAVGVQNRRDAGRFAGIGVNPALICVTGSIKFDVMTGDSPRVREDFRSILDRFTRGRPVVLAASTHHGEERLIAEAARAAGAFPLVVPRHAERRAEVVRDLTEAGFACVLRSEGEAALPEHPGENACYIADTTGELRDWTALADVAVIGKSFLASGGQNPVEAIAARVPVVAGPDMSNFADLVELLVQRRGITLCESSGLGEAIRRLLEQPGDAREQVENAFAALAEHAGATGRSVELLESARA